MAKQWLFLLRAALPRRCAGAGRLRDSFRHPSTGSGSPSRWGNARWPTACALIVTVLLMATARQPEARRGSVTANAPAVSAPLFQRARGRCSGPYILAVILFVLTVQARRPPWGFIGEAVLGWIRVSARPRWTGVGEPRVDSVDHRWHRRRLVHRPRRHLQALWILGLFQALSNLGYVWAASVVPPRRAGAAVAFEHQILMYSASALESFTGGLGTAAFLAFLMSIVSQRYSAAEYALLSSLFALTRHLAGFASGYGALSGLRAVLPAHLLPVVSGVPAAAVGAEDARPR